MLPTGDPLGTVVTMLATPFGRLDGLAIDTAGAGGWRPTGSPPDSPSEGVIDGLPGSVSFPRRKVVVDGPPWGKIVGQRSPDTAIAVAVEDGINHGSHLGLAWPPTGAAGGRRGFRTAHCWLVRSLGYGFGFIPFLRSRPPFWNRLSVAAVLLALCRLVVFYRSGRASRYPAPESRWKTALLSCASSLVSRTNWRAQGNFPGALLTTSPPAAATRAESFVYAC